MGCFWMGSSVNGGGGCGLVILRGGRGLDRGWLVGWGWVSGRGGEGIPGGLCRMAGGYIRFSTLRGTF